MVAQDLEFLHHGPSTLLLRQPLHMLGCHLRARDRTVVANAQMV
jgi:hypothetical protein